jgi:hypothetical protein
MMDITTFEKDYCESDGLGFTEIIGKYILNIYLGEVFGYIKSDPVDPNLDFNKYKVVGIEVEEIGNGIDPNITVNLNKLGIKNYFFSPIVSSSSNYYCYTLYIEDVEIIHNKLCELAGLSLDNHSNNKESACKCCGRINDMGAIVCWGFTCGVEDPTEQV